MEDTKNKIDLMLYIDNFNNRTQYAIEKEKTSIESIEIFIEEMVSKMSLDPLMNHNAINAINQLYKTKHEIVRGFTEINNEFLEKIAEISTFLNPPEPTSTENISSLEEDAEIQELLSESNYVIDDTPIKKKPDFLNDVHEIIEVEEE